MNNLIGVEDLRGGIRVWALENELSQYIDVYYNAERMHSTLDYVSPMEYENRNSVRSGEDAARP